MKLNPLRIYFLLFLLGVVTHYVSCQNITAWTDFNGKFRVYDNGTFLQLEGLEVEQFSVGIDWVAYITNHGVLKYYHKGQVNEITEGAFIKSMSNGTSFFSFTQTKQLDAIVGNKRYTLSTWLEDYKENDSIIFFKDGTQNLYNVFYNGQTVVLDDISPLERNVKNMYALGKNTFAYINSSFRLKVFFQNEFYGLADVGSQTLFDADQNLVAYTDRDGFNFRAFWKGNTYELSADPITKFYVANDMVAFFDMAENFKVFDSGNIFTIDNYVPEKFDVVDSVVVFVSSINQFNVYYKGKVHLLDNYPPAQYFISNGHVAWIDRNNWLQLFHNGKVINITKEPVTDVKLDGNILRYTAGVNDTKVWVDGKIF